MVPHRSIYFRIGKILCYNKTFDNRLQQVGPLLLLLLLLLLMMLVAVMMIWALISDMQDQYVLNIISFDCN